MEEAEIEVVSKGTVKPSSPTPPHLIHYQLSFLDQISPPVYNPLVLFYSSVEYATTADVLSSKLRTSLSETLTLFYPLGGRLKGNTSIDCSDQGIPFLETKVKHCRLSDIVRDPDPKTLRRFLPFVLDDMSDDVILGVQFNVLECGGIAVGLCLSHKIGDALCVFMFVKTWAAICRGEAIDDVAHPEFISAELFPPIDISGFEPRTGIATEEIVSKRFIFKSDVIDALKAKYGKWTSGDSGQSIRRSTLMNNIEAGDQRQPSRVEALSAFIWSRFAASTKIHSDPGKTCFVLHAVNLRTKFDPPLPDHSFGNLYRIAMTHVSPPDDMAEGSEYLDLVPKMRQTIRKIDADYVEKLRNGKDHLDFIKRRSQMYLKEEMMSFNITSLCRFPLYESDFGWGKPTWIGSPALTFKNLIVFMDTKSGDGIEAYVNLKEEDMAKFDKDEEFQARVSPLT